VLDWQDDPAVRMNDGQCRFERLLLVAPIMDAHNHRRVNLLTGVWFGHWTKVQIVNA
jgi:alpha-glucosidase (family GH31 glycosyl hydrolase)